MGFEDNKEGLGFEADQIDLDSDADLSMGTGRVKAQRKKGIKTEEVAFTKPKRDRFGRRSDGEETGSGADMLNPDKPTRIAGGFSRHEMTPQEVKPLQSENSKFGYLFSEDEEDEDEVSTVQGKGAAVDALSMKGDEADAGNIFERETRSVIHSQGKPQKRTESAEPKKTGGSGRFSKRGEKAEKAPKPSGSRFSKRSQTREAEHVKEEPLLDVIPTMEEMNPPMQDTYTEPAAEETTAEQEATSAVYADNQTYGYGNPYMYGQYPPPYNPYGGYPPQNPYGQPYPQQPYPYQYPPAGYGQPQYIPVGYVFQAGFVPVEMAHNAPQRRRRPSAARTAHRYDESPEGNFEDRAQGQAPRVRAIAARSEPAPEPVPEIVQQPEHPVIKEEPVQTYESQYDRIASEIPAQPIVTGAAEEKKAEPVRSAAPSRFSRRGASEQSAENTQETAPSRFAPRGSAGTASQPTESSAPSRFARRGSAETDSGMTERPAPSRFSSRGSAAQRTVGFEEDSFDSGSDSGFDGGFGDSFDDGFSAPASSGGRFKRRG